MGAIACFIGETLEEEGRGPTPRQDGFKIRFLFLVSLHRFALKAAGRESLQQQHISRTNKQVRGLLFLNVRGILLKS